MDRQFTPEEQEENGQVTTLVGLLHMLAGGELIEGRNENWAILLKAGYAIEATTDADHANRKRMMQASVGRVDRK